MLEKAKGQALKYLLIRIRSEKEIINYLKKKGYSADIIAQVITYLYKYQYLDDMKFCQLWIHDRVANRRCGRKKLYYELKEKGIASDIISEAMDEFFTEDIELGIAQALAAQKQSQQVESIKIQRFLLNRGFSYHIIAKALGNENNIDYS